MFAYLVSSRATTYPYKHFSHSNAEETKAMMEESGHKEVTITKYELVEVKE